MIFPFHHHYFEQLNLRLANKYFEGTQKTIPITAFQDGVTEKTLDLRTERSSAVVSAPACYLGGPGFRYCFRERLFWFSSYPPGKCWDSTLN